MAKKCHVLVEWRLISYIKIVAFNQKSLGSGLFNRGLLLYTGKNKETSSFIAELVRNKKLGISAVCGSDLLMSKL